MSASAARCLWSAAVLAGNCLAAPPSDLAKFTIAGTKTINIEFALDDGADDVQTVHLWYTDDEGASWHKYGSGLSASSPIAFTARREGMHGFYLIAENKAGPSDNPPIAGASPHLRVLVDYTPPTVAMDPLHQLRSDDGSPMVRIGWSVADRHLIARPVEMFYRRPAADAWQAIAPPVPNTGNFDWHVDAGLTGPIDVRIAATDQAGHRTLSAVRAIVLSTAVRMNSAADAPQPIHRFTGSPDDAFGGEVQQRDRASELLELGAKHAERGEYELATSLLRDALALDPRRSETLVELANVLYNNGRLSPSVDAFKLALAQNPQMHSALEGLARAFIGQRRFGDAVEQLSRIVRADPGDVGAWLHLGDVAVYQGDESLAREHYIRAATINSSAAGIVEKARQRMAHLKNLAAEFRQTEPVR